MPYNSPGMSFPQVITKTVVPPRSADLLHRERLTEFLHEHIDRKLIFIAAPAGYGKTSLLVDFAHETDLAVCWYSLDPNDRDLRVFVEGLTASIGRRYPGFGEETLRALEATLSLGGDVLAIAGTLVNEMVAAIPEWFVLILDDFHHVEDVPEVTAVVSGLLTYQPEHCHLIIASRTVPGTLPFIPLAARSEVVGLGQDDLRFTPEEVKALLLQDPQRRLPAGEAERLADASEGWITGILLASFALERGRDLWARARASGRPLYEYLAEEVLASQEPQMRTFLLASSTLHEMTAELCEAALGLEEAASWLTEAERRNLFIRRIDQEEERFRYHGLFREFLQARLRKEQPETFRGLHHRAAKWFEQLGRPETAAEHYLLADRSEESARVIAEAAGRLLQEGRLKTVIDWAERLSEEALRRWPALALAAAKAASRVGQMEQAIRWLELAEAAFRARREPRALGMALTAHALVAFNLGSYRDGEQLAQEALETLPGPQRPADVAVEALRGQGLCLNRLGKYEDAERRLREALELCQGLGEPHREVLIRTGLAACFHSQGRLEEAVEALRTVVAAARELGSPSYLAEALNDLAYNLYLLGDYVGALRALQEALETAERVGHRYVEAFAQVSLGEVLRDLGDPRTAIEHLERGIDLADELENVFLAAYAREAMSLAYLRLGDVASARAAAAEAVERARRQEMPVQLARHQATMGLIEVEAQQTATGLSHLREAVESLGRSSNRAEARRAQLFLAYGLHRTGDEATSQDVVRSAVKAYLAAGQLCRLLVEAWPVWSLLEQLAGQTEDPLLAEVEKAARDFRSRARNALRWWGERAPPALPTFRAYGFGIGRVERDGVPIPASEWPTATARHLFFYLLSHPPRTRDQIGADLWPDLRQSRLPGTFHNTKYRMQQALGVNPVAYEDGLYSLREDLDIWYDVAEFERLLERARRSPRPKRIRYLRRAVSLYRGDFLEGCYADWCIARREALRRQFLEATAELAEEWLQRGRFDDAIALLRRGLEVDNLREDFHRGLMRAYASKGQIDEAIAQYRRCAQILDRELSVEPAPETEELFRAIREGRFPAKAP